MGLVLNYLTKIGVKVLKDVAIKELVENELKQLDTLVL